MWSSPFCFDFALEYKEYQGKYGGGCWETKWQGRPGALLLHLDAYHTEQFPKIFLSKTRKILKFGRSYLGTIKWLFHALKGYEGKLIAEATPREIDEAELAIYFVIQHSKAAFLCRD